MAQHGTAVEHDRGMDICEAVAIADVSTDKLIEFVCSAPPPASAAAIFLSCTNMPTLGVIEPLEALFQKPVISSNMATFRAALQMVGVETQSVAPGQLFAAEQHGATG